MHTTVYPIPLISLYCALDAASKEEGVETEEGERVEEREVTEKGKDTEEIGEGAELGVEEMVQENRQEPLPAEVYT